MRGLAERCGERHTKRLCASLSKFAKDDDRAIVVKRAQRYLIPALVAAAVVVELVVAPPGKADCTSSGYATVCAQGDVRGADGAATVSGPVYPYPCADDWLCNDGVDIVWGPIWDPGRPGGPGRPG